MRSVSRFRESSDKKVVDGAAAPVVYACMHMHVYSDEVLCLMQFDSTSAKV